MTYPYNYYEHKHYKTLFQGLESYIAEREYRDSVPDEITKYRTYLLERHHQNPASILDYAYPYIEHPIHDEEDGRYPSEQFLISLAETVLQITARKFRQIMEVVTDAWYDFCMPDTFVDADDEHLIYRLSTGGWSGNEDIIDALLSNICIHVAMDVHNDGSVWTLRYRLSDGPNGTTAAS